MALSRNELPFMPASIDDNDDAADDNDDTTTTERQQVEEEQGSLHKPSRRITIEIWMRQEGVAGWRGMWAPPYVCLRNHKPDWIYWMPMQKYFIIYVRFCPAPAGLCELLLGATIASLSSIFVKAKQRQGHERTVKAKADTQSQQIQSPIPFASSSPPAPLTFSISIMMTRTSSCWMLTRVYNNV